MGDTALNQPRPVLQQAMPLKLGQTWDTRLAIGMGSQSIKANIVDISQQNTLPGLIRSVSGIQTADYFILFSDLLESYKRMRSLPC